MADVRALLAAERQSRRISHPYLTYLKSGALTCNVCNLNIKSEQLWPGHLKSANHRKNAAKAQEATAKPLKRKLDEVEDTPVKDQQDLSETRKKQKPEVDEEPPDRQEVSTEADEVTTEEPSPAILVDMQVSQSQPSIPHAEQIPNDQTAGIDENEWAAFERDVAPLAQPDYSAATISAAPVSNADLAAQQAAEDRKGRENEAEDEKEEESRRMEEEFEVMEEMEDRVRRLREKREALRKMSHSETAVAGLQRINRGNQGADEPPGKRPPEADGPGNEVDEDEDDDDDEIDDWYS